MYVDNIYLREANKIMEKKYYDRRCRGRDLKPGPPVQETGYPVHKDVRSFVRSFKRECYMLNLRFQNSYGVIEKDHVVGTASIWRQI